MKRFVGLFEGTCTEPYFELDYEIDEDRVVFDKVSVYDKDIYIIDDGCLKTQTFSEFKDCIWQALKSVGVTEKDIVDFRFSEKMYMAPFCAFSISVDRIKVYSSVVFKDMDMLRLMDSWYVAEYYNYDTYLIIDEIKDLYIGITNEDDFSVEEHYHFEFRVNVKTGEIDSSAFDKLFEYKGVADLTPEDDELINRIIDSASYIQKDIKRQLGETRFLKLCVMSR